MILVLSTDKAGETITVDKKFVQDNLGKSGQRHRFIKIYFINFNLISIAPFPSFLLLHLQIVSTR